MGKLILLLGFLLTSLTVGAADMSNGANNFYTSDKVTVQKVTFEKQYKMKVVGNLFVPKDITSGTKNPAIVVGHPMGAVKEQSANLYATKMAEQGFVTLSLDLSFWGRKRRPTPQRRIAGYLRRRLQRSGGLPGHPRPGRLEPDWCARDLRQRQLCHQRGQDRPRLKAIATVSMYDMGGANRHALRHSLPLEQRKKLLEEAAQQRYVEFSGGETRYTSGTVHKLGADTDPIQREFYDFYRTPRGQYTPKASRPNSPRTRR